MKQRKKLIIGLVITGIVLVFATINSIYNTYKNSNRYETTDAICIGEHKNYRT